MSLLGRQVNKILKEIKNGQTKSFEKLFNLTYNHLRCVAQNYLFDSSYIDDVVNESYLRIYKYIDSVDLSYDGYNWMCKIVQSVAYNLNKQFNVNEPIDKMRSHDFFYDVEDEIIEKNEMLKIIKTLPESDQELLYLRFWEDKTYTEIAKKVGQKIISVYRRIRFLLNELKKFL